MPPKPCTARFPAYKDLASFDLAASEVNEATVCQLHRGEFTERADNVVLIGGPGTGKTHVSTAMPDLRPREKDGWKALLLTRRGDRGSDPAPRPWCRILAILSPGNGPAGVIQQ